MIKKGLGALPETPAKDGHLKARFKDRFPTEVMDGLPSGWEAQARWMAGDADKATAWQKHRGARAEYSCHFFPSRTKKYAVTEENAPCLSGLPIAYLSA